VLKKFTVPSSHLKPSVPTSDNTFLCQSNLTLLS
jgi:hypothetical protein